VLLSVVLVSKQIGAGLVGAVPDRILLQVEYLLQRVELSLDELDTSQHCLDLQFLEIQPRVDVVGLIGCPLFSRAILVSQLGCFDHSIAYVVVYHIL